MYDNDDKSIRLFSKSVFWFFFAYQTTQLLVAADAAPAFWRAWQASAGGGGPRGLRFCRLVAQGDRYETLQKICRHERCGKEAGGRRSPKANRWRLRPAAGHESIPGV